MSWNIAKPGDQINGPVSITGALTSSSTISGTQIISTVATGTAPLTVASTTNVTNLNADLLDGQQGSYYQSADNINAGTLVVGRGGTGASTFTAGRVLFGNGTSALNTSANLFWDNTNNRLGIGTATPSESLDVNGAIYVRGANALKLDNASNNYVAQIKNTGASSQSSLEFLLGSPYGTKMTLDNSGNLGLGVTPASWSGGKAIQLGSGSADASLSGLGDDTNIATNAYYNAGWKYINGGYTAARYRQSGGVHSWFTATAGGSNGAAISDFTSAKMTLDASGNLGLGVTPSAWTIKALQINSVSFSVGSEDSYLSSNAYFESGDWKYIANASVAQMYFNVSDGNFVWRNAPSGFAAGTAITFTPRMVLDASGNLSIGTNAGNGKIHVAANGRYALFQPTTSTSSGYIGFSSNSFTSNRSLIGTDNSTGNDLWVTGGAPYALSIGTVDALPIVFATSNNERLRIKSTGQVNFVGQASDPAGAAAGDVYYNTTTNKLKCYNGTTWNDLF